MAIVDAIEQEGFRAIRQSIRKKAISERDAITPDVRHHFSKEIIDRLRKYLSEKRAHSIHCYISFRSEVETHEYIEHALREGLRVTVPIVEGTGETSGLAHTVISGLSDLVDGPLVIKEPRTGKPASLESLDAVIVPLVAFDRFGTRLGYGRGFYDRFLHELPRRIERIGLAFSIQEADRIPALPHDEPLDTIVTEKAIFHVPS
jgi:5-formyltetrahydrofolate cyclo-ligase